MQRNERAPPLDMLLAARDALEFAAGLTFSQFEPLVPPGEASCPKQR